MSRSEFSLGETYRLSYIDPHMVFEQEPADGPPEMAATLTGDCVYLDAEIVGLAAERLANTNRAVTYLPRCIIRSVVRLKEA